MKVAVGNAELRGTKVRSDEASIDSPIEVGGIGVEPSISSDCAMERVAITNPFTVDHSSVSDRKVAQTSLLGM